MKKMDAVMAVIFFVGGLVATGFGLVDAWSGITSYGWQENPGVILSSKIHTPRATGHRSEVYQAELRYRYQVEGYSLTGNVLYPGYESNNTPEGAEKWTHRFPVGNNVPVYVNPDNRRESMLAPGLHLEHLLKPFSGIAMVCISLFLFSGVRRRR